MFLLKLFSRRWWFTTLLVIAAVGLMIRLGIWQLDRLEQRQAFNAQVESARAGAMLHLNQQQPADLEKMEWRAVQMTGEYDFAHQVAVRNQYYAGQYGYHLLTPLLSHPSIAKRSGQVGLAVLVDRGWIPAHGNSRPQDWHQYDMPGEVKVEGRFGSGQGKPAFGGIAD